MSADQIPRRTILGVGALALLGALPGCSGDRFVSASSLPMACGEEGGTYLQFGRLLGKQLIAQGVAPSAPALPTHGSLDNLRLLQSGKAALAIALADSAAVHPWSPVALGRVYQNYLQFVVLDESPVWSLTDLAGLRVSIGAAGSGTAQTSERLLSTAGLLGGQGGVNLARWDLASATGELATGGVDAFVWSGGLPAPAIVRLARQRPIRLLDLSGSLDGLNVQYGGVYQPAAISASAYGLTAETLTIGVANFLLCREDLPDATAAAVVDVLIDRAGALIPEPSVGIQYLTSQTLIDTTPVPLHPGAAARYQHRHG